MGPCTVNEPPLSAAAAKQVHLVGQGLETHRAEVERRHVTTHIHMEQHQDRLQKLEAENEALKAAFFQLQKQMEELKK